MNRRSTLPCALLVCIAACSTTPPHRAEFSGGYPIYHCPESLEGAVRLSAEARPTSIDLSAVRQTSIATTGAVGRRVSIGAIPAGLRPEDRVIWSSLTLSTFGGTVAGWTHAQTDFTNLSATDDASPAADARPTRAELLGVTSAPGQVRLLR